MEQLSYGDMIWNLMQQIERRVGTPDLHSFKAETAKGGVFVEGRQGEVFIWEYVGDDATTWTGMYMAAANRLEMLGIKLDTVEM